MNEAKNPLIVSVNGEQVKIDAPDVIHPMDAIIIHDQRNYRTVAYAVFQLPDEMRRGKLRPSSSVLVVAGVAYCSTEDQYSRKTGRELAVGNLLDFMVKARDGVLDPRPPHGLVKSGAFALHWPSGVLCSRVGHGGDQVLSFPGSSFLQNALSAEIVRGVYSFYDTRFSFEVLEGELGVVEGVRFVNSDYATSLRGEGTSTSANPGGLLLGGELPVRFAD